MELRKVFKLLNLLGFLLVMVLNTLANALPINGRTTGEVSEKYSNFFVPAAYTFAIWALIYLLLLGFVIYQGRGLFAARKPAGSVVWDIGPWFFVSCLANSAWILAWHYEWMASSVVLMLVLLFSLTVIYVRLGIGERAPLPAEKYLVHLPFSVYLGWIMVATIANISAWLTSIGWEGGVVPPDVWTAVMTVTAAGLGFWFLIRKSDVPIALVLCWAFLGILIKRLNADWSADLVIVIPLAIALVALLLAAVLHFRPYFRLVSPVPEEEGKR